jgi:hypothetical protein
MTPAAYVNAIERAVMNEDDETVASIAHRMADGAEAMQILRARGYGTTGMDLSALARLVPKADKSRR